MKHIESPVTTWTSMSAHGPYGTFSLSSKVVESIDSALDHVARMHPGVEPTFHSDSGAGWRWTWEGVSSLGVPWSDTVRIF